MKHILITLLTFFTLTNKATASLRLQIIPNDSKYAQMQLNGDTQEELDTKLVKWINKQKFFKGEWLADQTNTIASKIEVDMEGTSSTLYFKPNNFTVNVVDTSIEEAEQETKKSKKKNLKDKLKTKDLSLKEINDLLRE